MSTTDGNFTTAAVTTLMTTTGPFKVDDPYNIAKIIIYTVVLLVGTTGLTVMISLLKTNFRSITTIAFLNLMVAHFLFLLTVPFRLYYYASTTWKLGLGFCKLVSAMVHIHVYMVFTIYAILLTARFLHFYKKTQRTEFYRRLHGLGASALVWIILLIIMIPIVLIPYGDTRWNDNDPENKSKSKDRCFDFKKNINNPSVKALNMVLSICIVTVSCLLTCVQMIILRSMVLKYGPSSRSQQEFWVQIKNLTFILIMLTCLVPYHLFRLHYLNNIESLDNMNEVFLAITGLTCFDMLTFSGKNICKMFWIG